MSDQTFPGQNGGSPRSPASGPSFDPAEFLGDSDQRWLCLTDLAAAQEEPSPTQEADANSVNPDNEESPELDIASLEAELLEMTGPLSSYEPPPIQHPAAQDPASFAPAFEPARSYHELSIRIHSRSLIRTDRTPTCSSRVCGKRQWESSARAQLKSLTTSGRQGARQITVATLITRQTSPHISQTKKIAAFG